MMSLLRKLASLRLSLVGMALLAVFSVVASRSVDIDAGITVVPLTILVVNLLAALLTNRSFRAQTGLLVFHVGLLLVFACIGLTVMLRFDGHVEVLQGAAFDASRVETVEQGRWHDNRLADLDPDLAVAVDGVVGTRAGASESPEMTRARPTGRAQQGSAISGRGWSSCSKTYMSSR